MPETAPAAGPTFDTASADTVAGIPGRGPGLPVDWSQAQVVTRGDTGRNLRFALPADIWPAHVDPTQFEIVALFPRQPIGIDPSLVNEAIEGELLQGLSVCIPILAAIDPDGRRSARRRPIRCRARSRRWRSCAISAPSR